MSELNETKNTNLNMTSDLDVTKKPMLSANCPKCRAALKIGNPANAYVCPVCNTVLRFKLKKVLKQDIEEDTVNQYKEEVEAAETVKVATEEAVEKVKAVSIEANAQDKLAASVMHEKNMQQVSKKQKVTKVLVQVALYAFLGFMALMVLFPFYFMLISSVKSVKEFELTTPTFFPKEILWSNYSTAFTTGKLGKLFLNTVYVGIVSTILSLVITVLSAFAFARLEFKGKNALFAFLLATMMIPGELFTITNYQTVNNFNWMNTYTVLIVPFLVSVFYIYLLKQNFMQIPNELYLAAKVDGTSDLKYLWKVMIPLALPTLISITILKMMGSWNSYIWPRLVANKEEMRLITNGLRALSFTDVETGRSNIPVQMAAVAMVSAPLFLVFVFLRKYIMKGVSRSGIKG